MAVAVDSTPTFILGAESVCESRDVVLAGLFLLLNSCHNRSILGYVSMHEEYGRPHELIVTEHGAVNAAKNGLLPRGSSQFSSRFRA